MRKQTTVVVIGSLRVNDQNFKDTLTNNILSFEQLGPGLIAGSVINPFYRNKVSDPLSVLKLLILKLNKVRCNTHF